MFAIARWFDDDGDAEVTQGVPVDELSNVVEDAFEALSAGGPTALDLRRWHGERLACVLRCCYRWQDKVPGWHDALARARVEVEAEGLPVEDVLFGLNRPWESSLQVDPIKKASVKGP